MKTIQFTASDKNKYTIFTNQITCIYPSSNTQGTILRLSCGRELHTQIFFETLLKMINSED